MPCGRWAGLRTTLVHELTHVAQDQHFDLGRLGSFPTDGANNAFHALVEGDAERIEGRYVEEMNKADRSAYERETDRQQQDADLGEVPPALVAFFGAPYQLGSELVGLLDETGGNQAVDDAFRTPPTSEAQLLDPFRFLARKDPRRVPRPRLERGDTRVEDGDFGALGLYFVLAARLDPHTALAATDGWAGDSYLQYEHAGKTYVEAVFVGSNALVTQQLEGTLARWAKAMPPGSADVARTGDRVSLRSCDPGKGANAAGPGPSPDSLLLPVSRVDIALELIKTGVPKQAARCIAGKVVNAYSVAQLADPRGKAFTSPGFRQRVQAFAIQCRWGRGT